MKIAARVGAVETRREQFGYSAAHDGLLVEKVGFRLLGKARGDQSGAAHPMARP